MKNKSFLFILTALFFLFNTSIAHDLHYDHASMRKWTLTNPKASITGSYLMTKGDLVCIQDESGKVISIPLKDLSSIDNKYVSERQIQINRINQLSNANTHSHHSGFKAGHIPQTATWIAFALLLSTVGWLLFRKTTSRIKNRLAVCLATSMLLFIAAGSRMVRVLQSNTNIAYLDSTFAPFAPEVHTYNNSTYYYVESKGIPTTHTMMVGISNHGWQQQVPIPQCYIGTNAWPIPLNPVIAANPIPVDSIHFTRGAIAIAANGVPIFNVHTNTGVDSYLDGQLDNFGGHCGRADDYHYHIAPLHLYGYTQATLPIAWGLDGFAVYGSVEPDGAPMLPLDVNHGHFGANGVYHYHGTTAAPYMIANMVGQVTEDATHQLIPQAAANPVRPALTPLNGALITSCTPNATATGYNLTYTLNNVVDSVVYYWDNAGHYTFNYYTATGLSTSNYTDFIQCVVPSGIHHPLEQIPFNAYYNAGTHCIEITMNDPIMQSSITGMELLDLKGAVIDQSPSYKRQMVVHSSQKGMYLLRIQFGHDNYTQKIIVR